LADPHNIGKLLLAYTVKITEFFEILYHLHHP
jgi:hypothetical protein